MISRQYVRSSPPPPLSNILQVCIMLFTFTSWCLCDVTFPDTSISAVEGPMTEKGVPLIANVLSAASRSKTDVRVHDPAIGHRRKLWTRIIWGDWREHACMTLYDKLGYTPSLDAQLSHNYYHVQSYTYYFCGITGCQYYELAFDLLTPKRTSNCSSPVRLLLRCSIRLLNAALEASLIHSVGSVLVK